MSPEVAVEFNEVTKIYTPNAGPMAIRRVLDRIKNLQFFEKLVDANEFRALDKVSFRILAGEKVGIVGHNGAGKSTLLRVISGISAPTSGKITVNGSINSVLNLGVGFHSELSGRDNIYLQGAIYGFSKEKIESLIPSVVEISELDRFIDAPLKHYSSGMRMRLGFALAMSTRPDIALLDEVLSVGDKSFREKSSGLMQQYLDGKTLIFVSHNLNEVRRVCKRTIVMTQGRVVFDGDTEAALDFYEEMVAANETSSKVSIIPGAVKHGLSTLPEVVVKDLKVHEGELRSRLEIDVAIRNQTAKPSIKVVLVVSKIAPASGLAHRFYTRGLDLNEYGEKIYMSFDRTLLTPGRYRLEIYIREKDGSKKAARSAIAKELVVGPPEMATQNVVDLGLRFD